MIFVTLVFCIGVGLGTVAIADDAVSPDLEQQDRDAIHFRRHVQTIMERANSHVEESRGQWLLRHRSDQQVVYFLTDETLDSGTPFGKLRQQRAINLLKHAATAAEDNDLSLGYRLFWQAAREDPKNARVLQSLGLPESGNPPITIRPARNPDRQLNWTARSYLQIQTPHFMIDARCSQNEARQIAGQLEDLYWIWTQVFYPLWENPSAIRAALTGRARFEPRLRRHRVVLFPNRQEYIDALAKDVPGIERSTGYYSNHARITFLYLGNDADMPTRYHELTHQLIGEATRMRVSAEVGLANDFWVVEGIACYMESLRFHDNFATVGGWESPRLAYARYRLRGLSEQMPLEQMTASGRDEVQQSQDIAGWYTYAAAYSHLFMDTDRRNNFMDYVRSCYERPGAARSLAAVELTDFLDVSDAQIEALREGTKLQELCLTKTSVSDSAFQELTEQDKLTWLDLSRLPLADETIASLVRVNSNLQQLSLEETSAGKQTVDAVARLASLAELDLALTSVNDEQVISLSSLQQLETLWLTATKITDAAMPMIEQLPNLKQVDVQRTAVSRQAVESLRRKRPDVSVNPIQIIASAGEGR